MKQDPDYIAVSTSYDPLLLYRLIEKNYHGADGGPVPVRHRVRARNIVLLLQAGTDD
jgi:hypothetical protein